MPNHVRLLTVPDDGRAELLRWSRGQGGPTRVAERVRIVPLAASGVTGPQMPGGPAALSRLWSSGAGQYAESALQGP
jgi:hypothetical protein